MKKVIILLAVTALLAPRAFAQDDKMLFNHLSLGITAGIDGIGLDVTMPATPSLQLRGGYSLLPISVPFDLHFGNVVLDDGQEVDLSTLPVTISAWKGGLGHLLLDYFPNPYKSFHLTAGLFAGSGMIGFAEFDARGIVAEEDYKTGFGVKDFKGSTDENGFCYMDARVFKVLPYLGIGFGHGLLPDQRVTFTFDLGIVYTGGIQLRAYDFSNPSKTQYWDIHSQDLKMQNTTTTVDRGAADLVAGIPVFPMMKFGLYFRLF